MNLKEYENLPDVLPAEKIALMLEGILDSYNENKVEKFLFLKILCELTDRQIMTYELLDQDLKKRIDEVLCKLWNVHSYEEVDSILYIVVNLGLEKCFLKVKMSVSQENISQPIKAEIEDTIKEVGENISNPYHSLNFSEDQH